VGVFSVIRWGATLLALGAWALWPTATRAAETTSPKANLLLVTIDTLRADRVSAYGYTAAQTSAMDRLAAEGVLVEDATVQAPQTRPSHVSLLTGLYPHEHGVRDNRSAPLTPEVPTLATILRGSGYVTAAFIGAYPVSSDSGLNRGFIEYDGMRPRRAARTWRGGARRSSTTRCSG